MTASETIERERAHTVGGVSYRPEHRQVDGPGGSVVLARQQSVVAGLLFRLLGQRVSSERILTALWPDPDAEPQTAAVMVRMHICELRQALARVSAGRVRITWERDAGYRLVEG